MPLERIGMERVFFRRFLGWKESREMAWLDEMKNIIREMPPYLYSSRAKLELIVLRG